MNSNQFQASASTESAQNAIESVARINLDTLVLQSGSHTEAEGEFCFLEAVAIADGQKLTDDPDRVCPTLRRIGIEWNDSANEQERQALKQYIALMPNTNGGKLLADARAWAFIDWTFRDLLPMCLSALNESDAAKALQSLDPISDEPALSRAMSAVEKGIFHARARFLDRAIDRALARARARFLDRAIDRALALDRFLALALALDLALDRARFLALALDRALDLALDRALDLALALDLTLDRTCFLALGHRECREESKHKMFSQLIKMQVAA